MKNENLWSIFSFFMTQNRNETNQEIKKNNQSRYNRFPRNLLSFASLNQSRFFFECFCCNGRRLHYFRMKSRKTSEKKLSWCFPCVFAGNICDNYGGTWKHCQNTKNVLSQSLILKPLVNYHLRKRPWPLFRLTVWEFSVLNLR